MKKVFKLGLSMCIVLTFLTTITGSVFAAATTNKFFNEQLSIKDNTGTGKGDTTQYTITVSANYWQTKTNTITITNNGETSATIGFAYELSNHKSCTIAGSAVTENRGNYSSVVPSGDTLSIGLSVQASSTAQKTATLTLTNITYDPILNSNINFEFDGSLGAVTVDGTAISGDETISTEKASVEIVANPVDGVDFVAWVDENGKIISKNSTYTLKTVGNITVKALFKNGSTPFFAVDDKYIFSDLNEAAAVENSTKIVLLYDAVLPAGNYTIPAGKTLLIPFDDANTLYTTTPGSVEGYTTPTVYRTLTMANGANITINGAVSVSAKQSASQGTTASPVGAYGHINMNDGSTITVNNGGNLYAWGYITGSGKITAKSGATVYENFQVMDWRGGSAIMDMIDNDKRVFPFSQYYVQNIEVPLTLEAGAVENGYMSVYVTLAGIQGSSIPFIGPNGMFKINSGSITKDYDEENDRLIINVHHGVLNMQPLSISMKLSLIGKQTVNSANYTLPINGNLTLHVNSGSEINISQDMALLPGGVINVHNGAKCVLASDARVFIYDTDEWDGYCYPNNSKYVPLQYAPGRINTRTDSKFVDAKVYIEGIVDASNGYVYVTESGANICGGNGGLVKFKQNADTTTYQATQSGTAISYVSISATTAKLKNGDDTTYLEHDGIHSEFYYADGVWKPTHTFENYVCECGEEKRVTNTNYSIADGNITITSELTMEIPSTSTIIIATYDITDKLLNSKSFLKEELESVTFSNKDVDKIRVFAWDGFDAIEPIALVEEKTVQQ